MSDSVLLVGGAGYIGLVVARHLLKQGYKVKVYDNFIYGHRLPILSCSDDPAFSFVFGDIRDTNSLLAETSSVQHVVILGGLVGDPITKKYPDLSAQINDKAIKDYMSQLCNSNLERVIFVSTCSNYGLIETNEAANENFKLNPLSLYAKSKVSCERHLLECSEDANYVATILRFATAFGIAPRMRFDLTVNEFAYELAVGNHLSVFDADTWRPYCHVQDFGRLISMVLQHEKKVIASQVFNAGGDSNNYTKRQIVELILDHLPEGKVDFQEKGNDPRNYRVNFSKVKGIGFEPAYSVEDGVMQVIDAVNSNIFSDVTKYRNSFGNYEVLLN